MPKPFSGVINVDIRDSTPDWNAFLPDKAPEGAPNVLVVLYDDTIADDAYVDVERELAAAIARD